MDEHEMLRVRMERVDAAWAAYRKIIADPEQLNEHSNDAHFARAEFLRRIEITFSVKVSIANCK